MTPTELRGLVDRTMASKRPHAEKMVLVAAGISEMLGRQGMEVTLVGGGAIEFYVPEVYATSDLDLIVVGRSRTELDAALTESGFSRNGRHWVRGEVFVEVPGNQMPDPVEAILVDGMTLRIVRREVVLADRIIGFKHWGATVYGAQAVALLAAMGSAIDYAILRERLRGEGAEDALEVLRGLGAAGGIVSELQLRSALEKLKATPPPPGENP